MPFVVVLWWVTCKFLLLDVWNIKPHFHLSKCCLNAKIAKLIEQQGVELKGLEKMEQMLKLPHWVMIKLSLHSNQENFDYSSLTGIKMYLISTGQLLKVHGNNLEQLKDWVVLAVTRLEENASFKLNSTSVWCGWSSLALACFANWGLHICILMSW